MVLELRGTRRAMLNRNDEPDVRRSSSRDSWRRAGEVILGSVRLTDAGDWCVLAILGEPFGDADSACVFADRNGCPEAGEARSAVEKDASSGSLSDVAREADGICGIGNGNPDGDSEDGDTVAVDFATIGDDGNGIVAAAGSVHPGDRSGSVMSRGVEPLEVRDERVDGFGDRVPIPYKLSCETGRDVVP